MYTTANLHLVSLVIGHSKEDMDNYLDNEPTFPQSNLHNIIKRRSLLHLLESS